MMIILVIENIHENLGGVERKGATKERTFLNNLHS